MMQRAQAVSMQRPALLLLPALALCHMKQAPVLRPKTPLHQQGLQRLGACWRSFSGIPFICWQILYPQLRSKQCL